MRQTDGTIRLDTLRALHEQDHKLAAYCATCELVARIHCRTCGRSVQIDPARLPPAPITERYRRR